MNKNREFFQITILNLLMDMDTVTDTDMAIKDMVMDTDIVMVMADTEVMDGKSFKLLFNKWNYIFFTIWKNLFLYQE